MSLMRCVEIYKEPYRKLFRAVMRARDDLDEGRVEQARQRLEEALLDAEDVFLAATEPPRR